MGITTNKNQSPDEPYDYSKDYGDSYFRSVFYIWYNNDKPSAEKLHPMLDPDPVTGKVPSVWTLRSWINSTEYPFKAYAAELDQELANTLRTEAIGEKIEMHKRHAEIGREMAQMGIEHLKEYGVEDPKTAVRAIVAGVDIESRSRGIGKILETINKMTDEDLDRTLKETLTSLKQIDGGIEELLDESNLIDD